MDLEVYERSGGSLTWIGEAHRIGHTGFVDVCSASGFVFGWNPLGHAVDCSTIYYMVWTRANMKRPTRVVSKGR